MQTDKLAVANFGVFMAAFASKQYKTELKSRIARKTNLPKLLEEYDKKRIIIKQEVKGQLKDLDSTIDKEVRDTFAMIDEYERRLKN